MFWHYGEGSGLFPPFSHENETSGSFRQCLVEVLPDTAVFFGYPTLVSDLRVIPESFVMSGSENRSGSQRILLQ